MRAIDGEVDFLRVAAVAPPLIKKRVGPAARSEESLASSVVRVALVATPKSLLSFSWA